MTNNSINQNQINSYSWNNPTTSQNPYQSRVQEFTLPGPNSLLAGAPPPPYHPLNRPTSPNSNSQNSSQDQLSRLTESEQNQFNINPLQFSNYIRDIQHITTHDIPDSTLNQLNNNSDQDLHNSNTSSSSNNNNNNTDHRIESQSISDSLLFDNEPLPHLRRLLEQMDRVYTPATTVSFDIALPSQTSTTPSNLPTPTWPIVDLGITDQPSSTSFTILDSSTHEHSSNEPVHQNRTHEFVDHSARMRSNRQPRLSPVPSSSSDHDISESLESFRRYGERLKRGLSNAQLDSDNSNLNRETDAEPRDPTTAELAEAAARASNEHHALPAFYSPDKSLKVLKVVIPVDTNPMERRKIIFDASKDGSIRWTSADQKALYEQSHDGLVGEEIGDIEFHYICFPKKKKRSSNSLSSLGGGLNRSSQPSSLSAQRPSNQFNIEAAVSETLASIDEARTQEIRSVRDHQFTHRTNRYQLYQHPRYRLVAASRRHIPLNRDLAFDLPNPRRHSSTINREHHRSSSRPTTLESFSTIYNNNNNPRSRLTRRPIGWPERFYPAPSDHYQSISSSNHHRDQEQDRNDDNHTEPSEQNDNPIHDDFDWDDPTPPFVQSPPFYESYSSHPLVHF